MGDSRKSRHQAIPLGAAIAAVPVSAGNMLFVNDDAGTLYAFRGLGEGEAR